MVKPFLLTRLNFKKKISKTFTFIKKSEALKNDLRGGNPALQYF